MAPNREYPNLSGLETWPFNTQFISLRLSSPLLAIAITNLWAHFRNILTKFLFLWNRLFFVWFKFRKKKTESFRTFKNHCFCHLSYIHFVISNLKKKYQPKKKRSSNGRQWMRIWKLIYELPYIINKSAKIFYGINALDLFCSLFGHKSVFVVRPIVSSVVTTYALFMFLHRLTGITARFRENERDKLIALKIWIQAIHNNNILVSLICCSQWKTFSKWYNSGWTWCRCRM